MIQIKQARCLRRAELEAGIAPRDSAECRSWVISDGSAVGQPLLVNRRSTLRPCQPYPGEDRIEPTALRRFFYFLGVLLAPM